MDLKLSVILNEEKGLSIHSSLIHAEVLEIRSAVVFRQKLFLRTYINTSNFTHAYPSLCMSVHQTLAFHFLHRPHERSAAVPS